MFIFCVCGVLCGSVICDDLITRSEDSYRVCVCLSMGDLETSMLRRPRFKLGCCAKKKKKSRCWSVR